MATSSILRADGNQPQFPDTLWSQISRIKEGSSSASLASFEQLCRAYWPCLHGWLLRHGVSRDEAADVTQSFFAYFEPGLAKGG